jgi:tetratricopeptide (TPR) repeat protein
VNDAPLPTNPHEITADGILADRLGNVAESVFGGKVTNPDAWPLIWKHQAALMKAAARLAPTESRFLRLEADAYAQLHDSKGELEALSAAIVCDQSQISRAPDDFVWNRDLDLRLADIQNAREKVDYLTGVIGSKVIPPYVRAHAARLKAQLQLERGEDESANKTLTEALTLAPLSIECLKLRYSMLPPNATRFERATQLLDLLRANPLQSQYSTVLADLIADSGLVSESLPFYNLAVITLHQQGDTASRSMLHLAAELFISDQLPDALAVTTALLKLDPSNAPAHFMRVLITRGLHDQDAEGKAMIEAGNAMTNRLLETMNAAAPAGTPKATTRPLNDPDPMTLPDLGPVIGQLKLSGTADQQAQFAEALGDLALLEGYFGNQSDASNHLVDSLKDLAPANSPEVTRLYGWNSFLAGKMDDAKAKFSSVAAQDPLAELGLIEVMLQDPAQRERAESIARRLLIDHPSGLLGAMLWERLHGNRIKLIPSPEAVALQTPLAAFPRDLFQLVSRPSMQYSIHVQPAEMHVGSFVGDPLLAYVRIDNIGSVDLTVGPDGVIKPELIFTLFPQLGDKSPTFQAFDLISGPSVLPHGGRTEQVVRVDQTQALGWLNTQPGISFSISGTLSTNEVANRLGGYQVSFAKPFYRKASDPNNAQAISALALQGRPDQQITALSQAQLFVLELRSMKNAPAAADQIIGALQDTIHKARADDLPAVAAWACKCDVELSPKIQIESSVRDMAESPDWRRRQLSILLMAALDVDARNELLSKLMADPQGSVRDDAAAMKGLLALPAPTSQPTTEPALVPPADTATPKFSPILPGSGTGNP